MNNVKTAVSLRKSLLERVDGLARELDIPRSHIFVMAVEAFLHRHENRKLMEELNALYETTESREEKRYRKQMRDKPPEYVGRAVVIAQGGYLLGGPGRTIRFRAWISSSPPGDTKQPFQPKPNPHGGRMCADLESLAVKSARECLAGER